MLYQISWSNYWSAVIISIIVYYVIICWKYYRDDLSSLLTSRPGLYNVEIDKTLSAIPLTADKHHDSSGTMLQPATDELKACLEQLAIDKSNKNEILRSLQQIVRKYPLLKDSQYAQSINQFIQFECYSTCGIHLSSEELTDMWMY
ncbi:hypothetical protein [Terrimonas alba]|uniref:hypothetical protein n=1 Tax=Terrimonas alba TaxID=3349636 RepID=UPI0035F428C8